MKTSQDAKIDSCLPQIIQAAHTALTIATLGLAGCLLLVPTVSDALPPRICHFDAAGTIQWIYAVPGHGYNIVKSSGLSGGWSPVVSGVVPTNGLVTAHVDLSGTAGFFRVVDTGVHASRYNPVSLGSMSGDNGTPRLNFGRVGDEFFSLRLTEDYLLIRSLSVGFTLISPAGMDYDLFVYYNGVLQGSSINGAGVPDVVNLSWDDNWGTDDSRTLLIEVRRYSGTEFTSWNLNIQGNLP